MVHLREISHLDFLRFAMIIGRILQKTVDKQTLCDHLAWKQKHIDGINLASSPKTLYIHSAFVKVNRIPIIMKNSFSNHRYKVQGKPYSINCCIVRFWSLAFSQVGHVEKPPPVMQEELRMMLAQKSFPKREIKTCLFWARISFWHIFR